MVTAIVGDGIGSGLRCPDTGIPLDRTGRRILHRRDYRRWSFVGLPQPEAMEAVGGKGFDEAYRRRLARARRLAQRTIW